jgi:hypothetical protein
MIYFAKPAKIQPARRFVDRRSAPLHRCVRSDMFHVVDDVLFDRCVVAVPTVALPSSYAIVNTVVGVPLQRSTPCELRASPWARMSGAVLSLERAPFARCLLCGALAVFVGPARRAAKEGHCIGPLWNLRRFWAPGSVGSRPGLLGFLRGSCGKPRALCRRLCRRVSRRSSLLFALPGGGRSPSVASCAQMLGCERACADCQRPLITRVRGCCGYISCGLCCCRVSRPLCGGSSSIAPSASSSNPARRRRNPRCPTESQCTADKETRCSPLPDRRFASARDRVDRLKCPRQRVRESGRSHHRGLTKPGRQRL